LNSTRLSLYTLIALVPLVLTIYVLVKNPPPDWLINLWQLFKQGLSQFDFPPAP
jgi:hypothetical protein